MNWKQEDVDTMDMTWQEKQLFKDERWVAKLAR